MYVARRARRRPFEEICGGQVKKPDTLALWTTGAWGYDCSPMQIDLMKLALTCKIVDAPYLLSLPQALHGSLHALIWKKGGGGGELQRLHKQPPNDNIVFPDFGLP